MVESRQALLTGGCQCGAIRYALYGQPERVHYCHCRMCQKASGNLFGTGAPVKLTEFAWTRGQPPAFRSSTLGLRYFCPQCGTPLAFHYEGAETISPTLGSFDHPSQVPPTIEYGIEGRLPWLEATPGMQQVTTDSLLSPERKARLRSHQHPDHDTAQWPRQA